MLKLTIPMPALSINHTHITTKTGKRIKKEETRAYEQEFNIHLDEYEKEFEELRESFNPKRNCFSVEYGFYINEKKFFNKNGSISKKAPDLDNLIKITQDLIFNRIANDVLITDLFAYKKPTKMNDYINIEIEVY